MNTALRREPGTWTPAMAPKCFNKNQKNWRMFHLSHRACWKNGPSLCEWIVSSFFNSCICSTADNLNLTSTPLRRLSVFFSDRSGQWSTTLFCSSCFHITFSRDSEDLKPTGLFRTSLGMSIPILKAQRHHQRWTMRRKLVSWLLPPTCGRFSVAEVRTEVRTEAWQEGHLQLLGKSGEFWVILVTCLSKERYRYPVPNGQNLANISTTC